MTASIRRVALALVAAIAVAWLAAPLFARADITGTWSGPVSLKGTDGQSKDDSITFDFTQNGKELTGTGAPSGQTPAPLKGTMDGDKAVFDVDAQSLTIHFELTLAADHLKGTVAFAPTPDVKVTGTLDLQRKK